MAQIKVTGIKKLEASSKRTINALIKETKVYEGVEEVVKDLIRSGQNPKTGRQYRKLRPLTIKHRKYIAKYNETHPDYKLKKSNLTLTGALIDGIVSRFSKTTGVLTIKVVGRHPGYKTKKGRKIKGSSKLRTEIAEKLEEIKRPFLIFTKKLENIIVERIEQALRRL